MGEGPLSRRLARLEASIGAKGRLSESRTAKRLGAKLRRASGALDERADMAVDCVLVEAKSTTADSIRLELSWLLKVSHEALMEGRVPVLTLTFTDEKGRPIRDGAWVLVPEASVRELLTPKG